MRTIWCNDSQPVGPAAWARIQALIPVAGEQDARGGSRPFITALPGLLAFVWFVAGLSEAAWHLQAAFFRANLAAPSGRFLMSIAIYAGMGIDRDSVYHDNRDWLRRSKSAIKAGYLIAGAALLQMGIRVVLEANLKYWCARPKHRSLVEMAKAIWLAGHATYVILTEVISHATAVIRCEQEVGNVAFLLLRRR